MKFTNTDKLIDDMDKKAMYLHDLRNIYCDLISSIPTESVW